MSSLLSDMRYKGKAKNDPVDSDNGIEFFNEEERKNDDVVSDDNPEKNQEIEEEPNLGNGYLAEDGDDDRAKNVLVNLVHAVAPISFSSLHHQDYGPIINFKSKFRS